MRLPVTVPVLIAALASTALAADDEAPEGEPRAVEVPEQAAIDAAVARGVEWLRDEQKRDGSFGQGPGETALALLTLRHAGVEKSDRDCERAARYLERRLPDGTVYGAALGVVALLEQDAQLHRAKVESLVEDLVAAQCENGQWSYGYRKTAVERAGDNSNSQFAMLALAAARARRIDVPPESFARNREFLVATQNEDGGFGYSDKERSRSYASMTAGAAMCLSLAVAVADDLPAGAPAVREDPAVRRSLAWLAASFDPERNTGAARAFGSKRGKRSDAFWRHYWLWSAERAGAACGTDTFGERAWYAEGARVLLERQHDDGQWRDPERAILATCFAILFFRRSTDRVITPRGRMPAAVTPSGGDVVGEGTGPDDAADDGPPDAPEVPPRDE